MSDLIKALRDPWARNAWASTLAQDAAAEIERLHSVETGYLARGLTIDRLTEQNAKLSRELAEARKENERLRRWFVAATDKERKP